MNFSSNTMSITGTKNPFEGIVLFAINMIINISNDMYMMKDNNKKRIIYNHNLQCDQIEQI